MRGEMQLKNKTFLLDVEAFDTNDKRENQDPEKHQHEAQHEHVSECARSCYGLLSLCSVSAATLIPCTHRMA